MIEVKNSKADAKFGGEFVKQPEQRDGIRTAGYADTNAVAGAQHPLRGFAQGLAS